MANYQDNELPTKKYRSKPAQPQENNSLETRPIRDIREKRLGLDEHEPQPVFTTYKVMGEDIKNLAASINQSHDLKKPILAYRPQVVIFIQYYSKIKIIHFLLSKSERRE